MVTTPRALNMSTLLFVLSSISITGCLARTNIFWFVRKRIREHTFFILVFPKNVESLQVCCPWGHVIESG